MLREFLRLMGFSPVITESESTYRKGDGNMQRGADQSLYSDAKAENERKRLVKNMHCYHCRWKTQGMDEAGRPFLHCMKTNSKANPDDCGELIAGCEE